MVVDISGNLLVVVAVVIMIVDFDFLEGGRKLMHVIKSGYAALMAISSPIRVAILSGRWQVMLAIPLKDGLDRVEVRMRRTLRRWFTLHLLDSCFFRLLFRR